MRDSLTSLPGDLMRGNLEDRKKLALPGPHPRQHEKKHNQPEDTCRFLWDAKVIDFPWQEVHTLGRLFCFIVFPYGSCKLYQHRPQTVSKRFAWTNISQKTISWLALPSPQEQQAASSMIFVGIDIAICSATLLSSKPGHRDQPQSSGRPRQGQEEDKARTQSRATEPSHRVQGRGQ